MSARPVVDLDVAPYAAELDCWGQDSRGWWALVTWCESVVQEKRMMRRSAIEAARSNVSRLSSARVAQLFPDGPGPAPAS